MKIYIDKETTKNVFFLRLSDLEMLRSKNIPIQNLPYLHYYNVSREDLLSWISYQRSLEMKVFGRKMTTYSSTPPLSLAAQNPKHDMEVLGNLLEAIYSEVKYYEDNRFYSSKTSQNTVVVLGRNDTVIEEGFQAGQSSLVKTLYRAVLMDVGYYKFYFNEPMPNTPQNGVDVPELISKILM